MKRLLCTLVLALCTLGTLRAQSAVTDEIIARLRDSRVSLKFSCTLEDGVNIELSGSLIAQGNCFIVKGNGLEIYSDGKTRWTVDPKEKEVYLEEGNEISEILGYRDQIRNLQLKDIKYEQPGEDLSAFRFDCSNLDEGWIVTDLRQE